MTAIRSPQDIFTHHVEALEAADLDQLVNDYSDDAILICQHEIHRGRTGARIIFAKLLKDLPHAQWQGNPTFNEGVLYLDWKALSTNNRVDDGADTFVFREGLIWIHTVRYTLQGS